MEFIIPWNITVPKGTNLLSAYTLKSINITSRNIYIVLQRDLLSAIIFNANQIGRVFTNEMIDQIYGKLYPLTQVSETRKMEHVNQVCMKKYNI